MRTIELAEISCADTSNIKIRILMFVALYIMEY